MLGLELRDTLALAVAVDDRGRLLARAEVETGSDLSAAAASALDRVAAAAQGGGGLGVAALSPGSAATLAAVRSLASRHAGVSLHHAAVDSGTAAAAAEAWTGSARDVHDSVYFAVADHTIAGIVRDRVPSTGAHGRAPAIAWLALNPVEREDYRKIGCLEAEVASAGIVRRLVWRIKAGDRSRVEDLVNGDLAAITLEQVLDAARQGDGVSISVVRDTAKYLGMAAANLVAIADPEMLVLGGIMSSSSDLFMEPVRTEITRRLPGSIMQALAVAPAMLGADAPAIGAARLAAAALQ
jgi:predicted NBD/HSP70 family sugar kinase